MNFRITRKDGKIQIYSGDYICYSSNPPNKEYFRLDVTAPACTGFEKETLIIKGKAGQILKMARNNIISLKYAGEIPVIEEEYFECEDFKLMDDEERENFVRSNIELPIQFVDSVEESEAIINCANEVLALWEKRSYKKEV